jgi:oligopeptidase B
MLDASLPLTTSEWIDGAIQTAGRSTMIKYSPMTTSPRASAMLVQVSLNDSGAVLGRHQISGKLRATKPIRMCCCSRPLGAGHGGASGRYDALRETAFTYSFMLWQMGITK